MFSSGYGLVLVVAPGYDPFQILLWDLRSVRATHMIVRGKIVKIQMMNIVQDNPLLMYGRSLLHQG